MNIDKNQIVYLFRHKETNYVKIGMTSTNDCSQRFQMFCTYSPKGGEIVGTIKTENALKLEKELHEKYKHKRMNGEFFNLSQSDCDIILENNKHKGVDEIINILRIMESRGDYESIKDIKRFSSHILNKGDSPSIEEGFDKKILSLLKPSVHNKMTATEISEYLKEKTGEYISPVKIGLKIGKAFDKKRVKRGMDVVSAYFAEPI